MIHDIHEVQNEVLRLVDQAETSGELLDIKQQFFGKKGTVSRIIQEVGRLDPENRPVMGRLANEVKSVCLSALDQRRLDFERVQLAEKLSREAVDVSLPGRGSFSGTYHPIHQMIELISGYFSRYGYGVELGPEVETDYYNFEALNLPEEHPARDMHDTFYLKDGRLLRTHTSPVQIHVMENQSPPIKMIVPGRVFRCDADASHSPVFHQIEGLCVAEKVTFSHLKATLEGFLHFLFGSERQIRFRPSYFPFTEPSVEVDVEWKRDEKGRIEWMEVLGAGMVHPNVFDAVNIDTSVYSGFAFGMGVERLAMLRFGIPDIRLFYENDQRFLGQF